MGVDLLVLLSVWRPPRVKRLSADSLNQGPVRGSLPLYLKGVEYLTFYSRGRIIDEFVCYTYLFLFSSKPTVLSSIQDNLGQFSFD